MSRANPGPFSSRAAVAVVFVGAFIALVLRAQPAQQAENPIAEFRRWLSLAREERAQILATRPERTRRALREKLEEYEAMPAEEREARLMALEIRWFMRPLMEMAAEDRAERLARVPEPHRRIVAERLQHWDLLPPPAQKELLRQELTLNYFSRPGPALMAKPMRKEETLARVPHPDRKRFEEKLDFLRALPPKERDEVARNFEAFFTLSPEERRKALHTLSDAERKDMEETLAAFDRLSPAQRRVCIEAFGKFARMTPAERGVFLRNVERWQGMSPEDRARWRTIVKTLPPLPPGLGEVDPPPMPPGIGPAR